MKTILILPIVFLWAFTVSIIGNESNPIIPTDVKNILDKKFPNWKFPTVDEGIRQFYKKAPSELNSIQGDFDGNGQTDYAVQIEYGTERNKRRSVFVLLRKGQTINLHTLSKDSVSDCLLLSKKGEKGYNWNTRKKFIFANDAIETVYFEKASAAYIYKKGKFRVIVTSD